MEENNVVIFEAFKNAKQWDEEYPKFLGNAERCFGSKINPEQMTKRLYYAMRYLNGVIRSYSIFSYLGIKLKDEENKRGMKYMIDWLEEMLDSLKRSIE